MTASPVNKPDLRSVLQHRRWLLMAGIASLLAAYLLFVEVAPRGMRVWRLMGDLQALEAQRDVAQRWETEMAAINDERERLRSASLDLTSLPRSDQTSLVFQVLQESADEAGVFIVQMRPAEKTAYDTHDELPLLLELEGSFHTLSRFVDLAERSRFLLRVDRIHFRQKEAGLPLVRASLRLVVVVMKHSERGVR